MDSQLIEFTPNPQLSLSGDALPVRPVRQFSNPVIQGSIDEAIRRAGSKHGAVVAHFDEQHNATLSIVGRLGNHWSVAAAAYKPWQGKMSYAAEVVFDW